MCRVDVDADVNDSRYMWSENNVVNVKCVQVADCARRYLCISQPRLFDTQVAEVEMPK